MDTLVIGIRAIIIGVILYQVARFLKGKLELKLVDSVSSGDALKGGVTVTAKKPMRGQLRVALVARRKNGNRAAPHDSIQMG